MILGANERKLVNFRKQIYLQAMVIPWIIWLGVFSFIPMAGILLAFKEYQLGAGFFNSPWVGLAQFKMFLSSPDFMVILRNTIGISFLKLITGFPAPIVFALLINELANQKFKKVVQTISYFPYFISWVVISGILIRLLSSDGGLVNDILTATGIIEKPIMFLGKTQYFWFILAISDIWKGVGFGSIIFLAAISNIDLNMYEAAIIDGANRWQKIIHITLPTISPTIVILLIFSLSGILNSNFDQIYLLNNPLVADVSEVLDTYIFKYGVSLTRYSFATAAGLFKSIIGFLLILLTNWLAKKINNQGIW